jgi:hypothetical protein
MSWKKLLAIVGAAVVALLILSAAYYRVGHRPQQPSTPQTPGNATLPPSATIEVWVGNTTVKTTMKPSERWRAPFNGTYEYVGNGWLHIKGGDWGFYIKMPPWRRIRVYVNYTAFTTRVPGMVLVVVRNGPVHMVIGTGFYTIPMTAYTIDRRLVDLYNRALEENNFDEEKVKQFFYMEREFYDYVTCYDLAKNYACTPDKLLGGPTGVLEPGGISPGDVFLEGSGEMWILVQVLEQ